MVSALTLPRSVAATVPAVARHSLAGHPRRGSGAGNASWLRGIPNDTDRADVWPLDPRGELMAVLQIETEEGVRNVDAILAVPGISQIFIGPADLRLSLGGSGPEGQAALEEGIQTVLRAAKVRNIPIGITTGAGTIEQRLREGFNFVTVALGNGGLTAGGAATLERGRAAAGRQ